MVRAEQCLAHSNFMGVELLYERVHYEACGYIRSRAYRLVEVSQRSGFGTNHICKLIAFSAFRLCELRSGALTQSISRQLNDLTVALAAVGMDDTGCQQNDGTSTDNKNQPKKEESETNGTSAGSSSKLGHYDDKTRQAVEACAQAGESTKSTVSNWAAHHAQQGLATVPTTRLDPALAKELALNHGILALRMPCVAPVIEWNVRLTAILLRLCAERGNSEHAQTCILHMFQYVALLFKQSEDNEYRLKPGTSPILDKNWKLYGSLGNGGQSSKGHQCAVGKSGLKYTQGLGFNGLIWNFDETGDEDEDD